MALSSKNEQKRNKRLLDIKRGADHIHHMDMLVRDNSYRLQANHPWGHAVLPPISGPRTSTSLDNTSSFQFINTFRYSDRDNRMSSRHDRVSSRRIEAKSPCRNQTYTKPASDKKRIDILSKQTKNIYSSKYGLFYEDQVSSLRMPVWKPLPSLMERPRDSITGAPKSRDPSLDTVQSRPAGDVISEGYAYRHSFPPASVKTIHYQPRDMGLPLPDREDTITFMSRVDKLLVIDEDQPMSSISTNNPNSVVDSVDIGALWSDLSSQQSVPRVTQYPEVTGSDAEHDFMVLEGLISGVFQRKPINTKTKCQLWLQRHCKRLYSNSID